MKKKIRVGIIGGGQLGMMLAEASSKLNIVPLVYSNTKDSPAAKVAKTYYGDFNDDNEDRLALNSQVRFQTDLENDNLSAKHAGDYDSDGVHEVYWKTNDGDVYLRSLMHADGNIRYANYQSEAQMSVYLTNNGYASVISDII